MTTTHWFLISLLTALNVATATDSLALGVGAFFAAGFIVPSVHAFCEVMIEGDDDESA